MHHIHHTTPYTISSQLHHTSYAHVQSHVIVFYVHKPIVLYRERLHTQQVTCQRSYSIHTHYIHHTTVHHTSYIMSYASCTIHVVLFYVHKPILLYRERLHTQQDSSFIFYTYTSYTSHNTVLHTSYIIHHTSYIMSYSLLCS